MRRAAVVELGERLTPALDSGDSVVDAERGVRAFELVLLGTEHLKEGRVVSQRSLRRR